MNQVLNFLKANSTFYLATDDSGQPHVRPFGAVADFEGKLYLVTSNQKEVFRQIKKNPRIEISVTGQDGRWLRLVAKAVEHDSRQARQKMLDDNPALKQLYSADDGKMTVLYLAEATATFCSFTDAPQTITF